MKKIYIIIGLTLLLLASPMGEERALALFNSIKQSEYDWVIEQWNAEMNIKTQSRASTRKSIWNRDENPVDILSNATLANSSTIEGDKRDKVIVDTPVLSPDNSNNSNDNLNNNNNNNNNTPPTEPKEPIIPTETGAKEPVTVPSIK